jgi:hypothetical protein
MELNIIFFQAMRISLLFLLAVPATASLSSLWNDAKDVASSVFNKNYDKYKAWKAANGYSFSLTEDAYRLSIFIKNLEFIGECQRSVHILKNRF